MSDFVYLPQQATNRLRRQIRLVQQLRSEFLNDSKHETARNLRVASRKLRSTLDYLGMAIPLKWSTRLGQLSKQISKRLGKTCESAANLKLLNNLCRLGKADPVAAEFFRNMQEKAITRRLTKSQGYLSRSKFKQYDEFLLRLKGSRALEPLHSNLAETRMKEFLGFTWGAALDEIRLRELRILTERLICAIEIQQTLSRKSPRRLLTRIRRLLEVLEQIQNFAAFQKALDRLRKDWNLPNFKLLPSKLERLNETLLMETISLNSRVYPLFSRIVPLLSSELFPIPRKPFRSSAGLHDGLSLPSPDTQAKKPLQRGSHRHHLKRLA